MRIAFDCLAVEIVTVVMLSSARLKPSTGSSDIVSCLEWYVARCNVLTKTSSVIVCA